MKCLKIILLFILLLHLFSSSNAQNYSLNNGFANGQTISTCTGTFYDAGINNNYGSLENYIVTFCPGSIGKVVQFDFSQIVISPGDTLYVYDGKSTYDKVLNIFTNINSTIAFTVNVSDTSNTGCLTFKFVSDGSVQAAGWKASIKCAFQCKQKILGTVSTVPAVDANGYINFCLLPNGLVDFNLSTSYPDNGLLYNQSDATSKFQWVWGDGKDSTRINLTSLSHTYVDEGGYNVQVIITDINGCINKVPLKLKLRTGIKPIFKINAPTSICVGDTVSLMPSNTSNPAIGGSVIPQTGAFFQLPISGDSLFLPDGTGVTYVSNLNIQQFAPGQTLTSINDLKGILINMEHSYLGDLVISLTAPNGITVNLHQGGTECFLGEPVDEGGTTAPPGWVPPALPLAAIAGKGYTYIFNNAPTYGTMFAERAKYKYFFIDNAGRMASNKYYLPAGSYTSYSPLNALVGTPLNGTWKLNIRDNIAADNGFLFFWKLDFDPTIFPVVETYTIPIASQNWVTPANGIVATNGSLATISPTSSGTHQFVYRIQDVFGCIYDTTINIQVKALPTKPDLGPDIVICNSQSMANIIVGSVENGVTYNWSNGQNNVNQISVSNSGSYNVTATNAFGCKSKDTVNVSFGSPLTASFGSTAPLFCASKSNVLKPIVSSNVTTYLWNDGSTADTLKIIGPGTYSVKCGNTLNDCTATAIINIADNPVNSFVMPIDTIICAGTSYTLTLTPPNNTSILWNDGIVGNTHLITGPKIYTTIANNNGCLKNGTLQVATKPTPSVYLGNDTFYCATKPNVLKLATSSNVIDYLWNNGSIADSLMITGPGIFSVKGSANGCSSIDSITIIDNPVNSYVTPYDTLICDRTSFYLTLSAPPNTSILWNDGAVGNTHLVTGPKTYSTLANNIGCLKPASFYVDTKPLPIISLGNDTALCNGETLQMKVSYAAASFKWNNGSVDTFLLAKMPGIYWVEGMLNQCFYRDSIEVKYKKCECETVIPNAFSPNGDGINDLFLPTMQCVPSIFQMSIFNRYGQPVFESRSYLKGWDGKKNGQPLPVGIYYYILSYFNNGLLINERLTGSITLLR